MCSDPTKINAAPGGVVKATAAKSIYESNSFDPGFRSRFDGWVERTKGIITLYVRCSWVVADVPEWMDGSTLSANGARELTRFQEGFKTVVENAWSYRWELKPAVPFDCHFTYKAAVRIENVEASGAPHLKISLRNGSTGTISAARPGPNDDFNREMDLKLGLPSGGRDVTASHDPNDQKYFSDIEYFDTGFPIPPTEPTVFFRRCTAVHEFGHHIGLHHPHPEKDPSLDAYGSTEAEAEEVMGWGSLIKAEHYAPFLQVAKRLSADANPGGSSTSWTVVPANS